MSDDPKARDMFGLPELTVNNGNYRLLIGGAPQFTLAGSDHEWALRILRLAQLAYRSGRLDKEREIQFARETMGSMRAQRVQRKDKPEVSGTVSPIVARKAVP